MFNRHNWEPALDIFFFSWFFFYFFFQLKWKNELPPVRSDVMIIIDILSIEWSD